MSRLDGVVSLSELRDQLQVSAQAIYDLRSQGRCPRGGFRVGRDYTLAEITTGRVEWFLRSQGAISASRSLWPEPAGVRLGRALGTFPWRRCVAVTIPMCKVSARRSPDLDRSCAMIAKMRSSLG